MLEHCSNIAVLRKLAQQQINEHGTTRGTEIHTTHIQVILAMS